ncbi:unnamed protein product [Rhizophagus irregularis]|nr:unnamed protein product [Rhizophagus irregularis]
MSKLFQSVPGKISFALDSWTLMNGYSFLAIMIHWITKDWRLQDKLLDFIDLSGPHSGENLCNAFVKSCHEFSKVVQEILKQVKASEAQTEDDIMDNMDSTINAGEIIPKLCKLKALKIFVQTTKILSTAKYPMLSSSIPIYNYLIDGLEAYCEDLGSSKDIVIAVKAGLEKLEFYYEKSDETTMYYTIATVLDPRFKLEYYEDNR